MAKICPKCGGTNPGCDVCDAPPRRDISQLTMSIGGLWGTEQNLILHYPLPEGIRISQLFGVNPERYPTSKGHNGVDWACIVGTPVYAMRDGEVIRADANDGKNGYGRHVRIAHANYGISIYGHLSALNCSVGDQVVSGQLIGWSGGALDDPGSGWSTGPHLHAEYRITNVPNPVPGGYTYNAINILPLLVEGMDWAVQGVDLSSWNGNMDFNILRTKVQYCVIRLGYGDGWKDSRCDTYRTQAIDVDMPYFGYWYTKAGQNIDAHANGFASVAAEKPGLIGYEEDFEYTIKDKVGTLDWIKGFDTKLKSLVNKKTSPYSNWNFWYNSVASNTYFTEEQWVANWTTAPSPYMPPGWIWRQGCKWQWSADGNGKAREYGMVSDGDVDMDLDRYYGTVDEFNLRYGTHILPIGEEPPPPPPPCDFIMQSTVNGLRVRKGPGTTYEIVGSLNVGDKVSVMNVGGSSAWVQIKSGPYAGKWCAVQTVARYMEPSQ